MGIWEYILTHTLYIFGIHIQVGHKTIRELDMVMFSETVLWIWRCLGAWEGYNAVGCVGSTTGFWEVGFSLPGGGGEGMEPPKTGGGGGKGKNLECS